MLFFRIDGDPEDKRGLPSDDVAYPNRQISAQRAARPYLSSPIADRELIELDRCSFSNNYSSRIGRRSFGAVAGSFVNGTPFFLRWFLSSC